MKAYVGSRGIALLIVNPGARWGGWSAPRPGDLTEHLKYDRDTLSGELGASEVLSVYGCPAQIFRALWLLYHQV